MLQDLRFGFRILLKSPGYALAAIATLAIGIGATTAIASVVGSVLLRPLPYPDAERVVMVYDSNLSRGWDTFAMSPGKYLQFATGNHSFEAIAALEGDSTVLTGQGEPEALDLLRATGELGGIAGLVPALGRLFTADEEVPGGPRVVVITDALFQSRFGGRPETLGATITLDAEPATVVGILPAGQRLPQGADILAPRPFSAEERETHGSHYLVAMARLKPGVTAEAAQADLEAIAARLAKDRPDTNTGWSARVIPLMERVVGKVRPALYALSGAIACLLLLACANVANLVLARSAARRPEIALRAALGAGSGRLLRQLLTESLLLSLAGGAVGALIGWWGVDLIRIVRPANLPRIDGLTVDGRVLGLALAVSIFSGLLFGTIPALLLARSRLQGALAEGGRGVRGRMSQRVRAGLVSAQVALAIVMLVGTGLQLRSLDRLLRVDPGFDPRNTLTLDLALPQRRYPDRPAQAAFYDKVVEGLAALPGVKSAAMASSIPNGDNDRIYSIEAEGRTLPPDQAMSANWASVSPGYFATAGIPLRSGRHFDAHDAAGSMSVVIVNDLLVRRLFAGEDPIGKRLVVGFDSDELRTIVGVVGNVRFYGLDRDETMQMYEPLAQRPSSSASLLLRTATDPEAMAPAARAVVRAADPEMAVMATRTMQFLVDYTTGERRFALALLGCFAAAALILAAVGVYGVVAYGVSQRTHEIGVRMALGAERRAILGLVLREGMAMAIAGVGAGLLGALALARLLQGMLFGVGASDPLTYAATAAVMSVVALVATWVPARRATRVEPTAALRCE